MHRFCDIGLPPSAATVKATKQIDRASAGNASNSLRAARIHETGRVFGVIAFSVQYSNVVIYDNIDQEKLAIQMTTKRRTAISSTGFVAITVCKEINELISSGRKSSLHLA